MNISTVAVLFASGSMGLSCSNSHVVDNVADAALASGGQAGSSDGSIGDVCMRICTVPVGGSGLQCQSSPSCAHGDIPITSDEDCGVTAICYTAVWCGQSIRCRQTPYGGICRGTWSDGGVLEPPDASADGDDAGMPPCCGDGFIDGQHGEQCDLGPLTGACVDENGKFAGYPGDTDCPPGTGLLPCSRDCQITCCGP
jgi:hypothetical protein